MRIDSIVVRGGSPDPPRNKRVMDRGGSGDPPRTNPILKRSMEAWFGHRTFSGESPAGERPEGLPPAGVSSRAFGEPEARPGRCSAPRVWPGAVYHFACAFRGRPRRTGLESRLAAGVHAAPPQGTSTAPATSGLPLAAWSALGPCHVPSPQSLPVWQSPPLSGSRSPPTLRQRAFMQSSEWSSFHPQCRVPSP